MRLSCQSFVALIINLGARKTNQGNHAPKEQVHFLKIGEFLQHPGGNQPVIGMIINYFNPHFIQQFIETLCGKPFEKGICRSFTPHPINNLITCQILVHHLVHRIDIILPITIDGNGDITEILGFHQSCQHRILMSAISALGDANKMFIFL